MKQDWNFRGAANGERKRSAGTHPELQSLDRTKHCTNRTFNVDACDAFAFSRGATVEAGVNLTREDAYRRMHSYGYRVAIQGVAMQRPHVEGSNRADAYVIDDWR